MVKPVRRVPVLEGEVGAREGAEYAEPNLGGGGGGEQERERERERQRERETETETETERDRQERQRERDERRETRERERESKRTYVHVHKTYHTIASGVRDDDRRVLDDWSCQLTNHRVITNGHTHACAHSETKRKKEQQIKTRANCNEQRKILTQ